MPLYEASSRSTLVTATAGAVLFGFRASTSRMARIREIQLFNITAPATSGALGLVRSTALGTGALTAVAGMPLNPDDPAAGGQVITNWATAVPTTGGAGATLRRIAVPATIGNGVMWVWDREPLIVPPGSAVNGELAFINLQATAPGTWDVTVVWEE